MFVQEWHLLQAMPTPPKCPPGGGQKVPGAGNFLLNFFTNNFDINISLRELTQHTIEIYISRPIDFTHMNIYLKSISINHNVAP